MWTRLRLSRRHVPQAGAEPLVVHGLTERQAGNGADEDPEQDVSELRPEDDSEAGSQGHPRVDCPGTGWCWAMIVSHPRRVPHLRRAASVFGDKRMGRACMLKTKPLAGGLNEMALIRGSQSTAGNVADQASRHTASSIATGRTTPKDLAPPGAEARP